MVLNQTLSDEYLYHWSGKIGGTGTNRRAGLHFMCSSPNLSNRGNSYFIYARLDGGAKLQIYETVNDTFYLMQNIACNFLPDTWYDFKTVYNKLSGKIDVYINDVLSASWIDATPLTTGSYVSFRSGECTFNIDNFEVFRSRNSDSALVKVGAALTNDLLYINNNPSKPAGRIRSLVRDEMDFISAESSQNINIDWTKPTAIPAVRDGLSSDIATTTSTTELSANWNASSDANSGVVKYYYAIGTTSGGTDVANWTDNGPAISVTKTGLILVVGKKYFFSVVSQNAAGLSSIVKKSNGQKVVSPLLKIYNDEEPVGDEYIAQEMLFAIYPNPVKDKLVIAFDLEESANIEVTLLDISGKLVSKLIEDEYFEKGNYSRQVSLETAHLTHGIYLVNFVVNGNQAGVEKVVLE